MSIDIFSQDRAFWQGVSDRLHLEGMAVIRSASLPQSFDPPVSDLVFLVCEGGIEMYMDARVVYLGDSALWQNIQSQESFPGETRLIAQADPDAQAAFRLLRALFIDAGMVASQAPQQARMPIHGQRYVPTGSEDDDIPSGVPHKAPLP